jgi:hypothetical protein
VDLYVGQVDPLAPDTHQVHDFNPGIMPFPDGLFWTISIPDTSVHVDLTSTTASLHLADVALSDYGKLANAFANGPSTPATVSIDIAWSGVKNKVAVNNPDQGFVGVFWEDTGTFSCTAKTASFAFASDPPATAHTNFAEIGQIVSGTAPSPPLSARLPGGRGRRGGEIPL